MKHYIFICLFLLVFSRLSGAQEDGRKHGLAVLDFQPIGIAETEALALSDILRSSIANIVLEKSKLLKEPYSLIERSQMDRIFDQFDIQNTGCTEVKCAIEFGKMLSSDRIIIGSVSLVGSTYVVTARIVDVETSKVLVSVNRTVGGVIDNVIDIIPLVGHELLTGERLADPISVSHTPISDASSTQSVQNKHISSSEHILESIGITMVKIPGGTFQMGSVFVDDSRNPSYGEHFQFYFEEKPIHMVTISLFFISTTEITVGQFKAFVNETGYLTEAERSDGAYIFINEKFKKKIDANWKNPYMKLEDDHPVVCVSWNDAKEFCEWLSRKTGQQYRLPTEAEWEYACRAGTTTNFYTGDTESDLERAGWYYGNSGKRTHPVGQKAPNKWGLYDMHGNVEEWCLDWFGDYTSESETNPTGPTTGSYIYNNNESRTVTFRVSRGGSWYRRVVWDCRSACRFGSDPSDCNNFLGFRIVRRP